MAKDAANRAVRNVAPVAKPAVPSREEILARRYKKPFLSKVIVRADFSAPIVFSEYGIEKRLREHILKRFPILEHEKHIQTEVLIDAEADDPPKSQTKNVHRWVFMDKTRKSQLILAHDNLAITYEEYSSYSRLREDLLSALDGLFKDVPAMQFKRLGLRYIDNIEIDESDPTNWSKYLSDNLLAIFSIADDRKTIARAFQILEFAYEDMRMRFQFGMPNPDFPAAIRKKMFALDYDAYTDLLLDPPEVPVYLDRFHDKIKLSFEEVIKDELSAKWSQLMPDETPFSSSYVTPTSTTPPSQSPDVGKRTKRQTSTIGLAEDESSPSPQMETYGTGRPRRVTTRANIIHD